MLAPAQNLDRRGFHLTLDGFGSGQGAQERVTGKHDLDRPTGVALVAGRHEFTFEAEIKGIDKQHDGLHDLLTPFTNNELRMAPGAAKSRDLAPFSCVLGSMNNSKFMPGLPKILCAVSGIFQPFQSLSHCLSSSRLKMHVALLARHENRTESFA